MVYKEIGLEPAPNCRQNCCCLVIWYGISPGYIILPVEFTLNLFHLFIIMFVFFLRIMFSLTVVIIINNITQF